MLAAMGMTGVVRVVLNMMCLGPWGWGKMECRMGVGMQDGSGQRGRVVRKMEKGKT